MNYSKLYDPSKAGNYVWAMTAKNAKFGDQSTYQLTLEPSPKMWEERGYVLAAPYQTGMYRKEDGVYMTYCPPVEGVRPGKYIPVLSKEQINEAKSNYERDKTYTKYGTSYAAAI